MPGSSQNDNVFNDDTSRIIGCAIEVHKVLGPGFQEVVYQRALSIEMEALGLEFAREQWLPVFYKNLKIDTRRIDFVVGECLVEIKAREAFRDEDYIQTLSYLRATRYRVALLINFGSRKIEVKRLINEKGKHRFEADSDS